MGVHAHLGAHAPLSRAASSVPAKRRHVESRPVLELPISRRPKTQSFMKLLQVLNVGNKHVFI